MRWTSRLLMGVASVALIGAPGLDIRAAAAQEYEPYPVEARVWLDRGEEPVLRRGERVRLYYRVSENAFVAVFQIDTNGTVRMVFPSSPQENHYARAGRDYRVLFPGSTYWYVNDDPGVGYFFVVASPEPFDFSQFGYSHYAGGWDLSVVGRQVYGDPYLAMDDFVAALIPDWEYVSYGLDFTAYHVDGHYDYPRFLCYDCHGFRPYYAWNPYAYTCTTFRLVIFDDPYFYPATRYHSTRVVYVQPRRGVPRFTFKERAVGEPGVPQVVLRNSSPNQRPGVEGGETRRAVPRSGLSSGSRGSGAAAEGSSGGTGVRVPGVRGSEVRRGAGSGSVTSSGARRPSEVLRGGRTNGGTGTTSRPVTPPTRPTTTGRPVLERRPSTGGSRGTPPATSRPTTVRPPSSTTGRTTVPPTSGTAKTRKPGGGGSGVQSLPSGRTRPTNGGSGAARPGSVQTVPRSGATRPTRVVKPGGGGTTPTRSSGSSGRTVTRSAPAVRGSSGSSGRTVTRSAPTVRGSSGSSGRTVTRSAPAVRGSSGSSGKTVTRSAPAVRGNSGSARGTSKAPPKPRTVTRRKPGGGG